ncbi:MAG: biotin transporter BioY [Myxococcota bacterium]|nr:biotin transporter BioY [Myxococcota bacterium]
MPLSPWLPALLGAVAIALGAQLTVPMLPVPMTLQTLAVIAAGLIGGPRVGALAGGLYLALVLLGLPVLAEGKSSGGLGFFSEPSAGYVLGFWVAAALAGWLAQRGLWWGLLGGLAGHAAVLAIGVAVLAFHLGFGDALKYGLWPFLPGAAVKSLAAWGIALGVQQLRG